MKPEQTTHSIIFLFLSNVTLRFTIKMLTINSWYKKREKENSEEKEKKRVGEENVPLDIWVGFLILLDDLSESDLSNLLLVLTNPYLCMHTEKKRSILALGTAKKKKKTVRAHPSHKSCKQLGNKE